MNTIIILSHLGLGHNIFNILLANYLSKSNKVEFVCKKNNAKNMEYFFRDNNNISLFIVNSDSDISLKYGCPIEKYKRIINGKHMYASGCHINNSDITSFPFFMYNDIGINTNILKEHSEYKNTDKSIELYNIIKNNQYIFVCNNSSDGEIFNINNFLNENKINLEEIIVICSNKNYYSKEDKFYNIAQKFVYETNGLLILDYKLIIENALIIAVTDSSLFCFTLQLQLNSNNNFLYTRPGNKFINWGKVISFFNKKFYIK
jgi:hypothetical protein